MKNQRLLFALILLVSGLLLTGCTKPLGGNAADVHTTTLTTSGAVSIKGEAWADNWFALYLGETLLLEDSVPIDTERSFNAESFTFAADYPLHLNFILKDFKENDTGLEYIQTDRQQMGDGGFIAQFTDVATGSLIAVSDASWKCIASHQAPLDKACESAANPVAGEGSCTFSALAEPEGWKRADFDDSHWANAAVYAAALVSPKDGYDQIDWQPTAQIIWGADLETVNTLLCRVTVAAP